MEPSYKMHKMKPKSIRVGSQQLALLIQDLRVCFHQTGLKPHWELPGSQIIPTCGNISESVVQKVLKAARGTNQLTESDMRNQLVEK
jgi:hypothetical protein